MSRLTDIIPRPVSVRLGRADFPVWEARLSDLADVQAWVDALAPDHAADALDAAADPALDDAARDRLLFGALDAAGDGPPVYHSPGGRALLATAAGTAAQLWVALRRGTPGLTPEGAVAVLAAATPAQLARFRRAFYGLDARREVERRLLDGVPAAPSSGRTVSWDKAIWDVIEATGWTPATVYSLSLTEFRAFRCKGEPPEDAGVAVDPRFVREAARIQAARYRRAYGLPPEEEAPPPPAPASPDPSDGWVIPRARAGAEG